ncbi:MAG TPA: hypothetical protein VFW11_24915 [Cyclobacteriaceae bacterium]|nr:hypothetical protein [Cyclobacteriaceae bacterium]
MPTIKNVILLALILCLAGVCYSQSIKVKKETSRIKGENTDGYSIDLEGTTEEVSASLIKYFKSIGKVKQSDGIIMLTESLSVGSNVKSPVYGVVKEKASGAQAWIGILPREWSADQGDKLDKELEKMLHEFGVKYHKEKVQSEIDASTQALTAVDKQQQRLLTESKNLNLKLENNKKEKLRLEKALEDNKLDYETLLMNIDKNKHAQDSVALAGDQIKKVMEQQKQKQAEIN